MTKQEVAIDAVPLGFAQDNKIVRVQFQIWSQVERDPVMGDQALLASAAGACVTLQ